MTKEVSLIRGLRKKLDKKQQEIDNLVNLLKREKERIKEQSKIITNLRK